ncbi:hypothetical protein NDU88_006321 [Pleurodeles waltl]|uniref:Uncharacterized protein n=1 Tax=Pleurodeles waltl TaxID=8319 RepID=A0AAV7MDR4_PLEWA|nr:hypothetical protein NDU88_006321 [Pleurodeles waltl]
MLLVVFLLLCCGYAGVLDQSAVNPWKKSKREVQRNSGELLHSLSDEIPTGETLNSPQMRIGYRERTMQPDFAMRRSKQRQRSDRKFGSRPTGLMHSQAGTTPPDFQRGIDAAPAVQ